MVVCLGQGADLHVVVSGAKCIFAYDPGDAIGTRYLNECRLVRLPSYLYLFGAGSPG